ncbi:hypothetical protein LTS08_001395 [Lithohypha guttulata]|nr:hypothetical protein LTS08_001395 [Lithohypha guttulata]
MDPFAVLGLRQDECTEQDVKKAYRNLALKHHPDKAGPSGLAKMKELNRAHDEILSKQLWRLKPRPTKDVLRQPLSSSTPQAPPSPGTEDGLNAFLRAYKVPASSSSSADYKIKSQSTPDNSTIPFQLQNFAEYTILLANFIESKLPQPNSWPSPAQRGAQWSSLLDEELKSLTSQITSQLDYVKQLKRSGTPKHLIAEIATVTASSLQHLGRVLNLVKNKSRSTSLGFEINRSWTLKSETGISQSC